MAWNVRLQYCICCGEYLGPDNMDGICSKCDTEDYRLQIVRGKGNYKVVKVVCEEMKMRLIESQELRLYGAEEEAFYHVSNFTMDSRSPYVSIARITYWEVSSGWMEPPEEHFAIPEEIKVRPKMKVWGKGI